MLLNGGTGVPARPAEQSSAQTVTGYVKPGDTGFARADLRFSHEYVTPMAAIFFERYVGKDAKVNDPASILFFRDHLTFLDEVISEEKKKLGLLDLATQLKLKQQDFAAKQGIKLHGELKDRKGSEGICHSIVLESYALPGQLNIGSDSHTPHVGAIGCVAFGIGTTDVFNSWITKDVRVKVPESVKITIRGRKHPNVTAKDFILKILSLDYVRSGKALAKVMEYAGEAIEELSVDERATMTNMAAEIGGFTGIVAPDRKAVDFLVERRGMDRKQAESMIEGLYSDPGAQYAHTIELDAAEITPMVATPGDPGNGKYVRELNTPVPIELAYGGTCTAGKNEDMDMYARVLADALKQGKRVPDSVKFYIQFGSQETRDYCIVYPGAPPSEIGLRVAMLRRRAGVSDGSTIRLGALAIDTESYRVTAQGRPLDLTFKEFELLRVWPSRAGRVFTRPALLREVWGYDFYGGTRTVDVHVRRLRAKLGPEHEHLIQTVRSVGYRAAEAED